MENVLFKSNEELIEVTKTLSVNHDKIKQEIILLHEMLKNIESEYIEVVTELQKRNINNV